MANRIVDFDHTVDEFKAEGVSKDERRAKWGWIASATIGKGPMIVATPLHSGRTRTSGENRHPEVEDLILRFVQPA